MSTIANAVFTPLLVLACAACALLPSRRRRGGETPTADGAERELLHDDLTKLPNRTLFRDRLERALARNVRRRARCAVLAVDLDRFRLLADSLGQSVGEQLLCEVATRLDSVLRPEDTVARTGGDEFMVLLETVHTTREAAAVAERVIGALSPSFQLNGRELYVTGSIGIALGRGGRDRPEDVLQNAEVASHRAQDNGGARYELFRQEMSPHPLERIGLDADLRRGMQEGEFLLRYQPSVELPSGRIVGTEALVHWRHRERGLLGPAEFLPVAEETGLALPLGRQLLEQACRQAAEWVEATRPDSIVMSVAVSARQLEQPRLRLVDDVASALAGSELAPGSLRIQLVERAIVDDVEAAVVTMHDLHDLGIQLALDEFGGDRSALGFLRRFRLEVVKLDAALVHELGGERQDQTFARALVAICHAVGARVLAGGIESREQAAFLAEVGCDLGQGPYFGEPLPAEELEPLLHDGAPLGRGLSP